MAIGAKRTNGAERCHGGRSRRGSTALERSQVTWLSARSDVLVNHLSVGDGGNSQASLVLDGRTLAVTAGMDVGKYDGSEGKLTIKSGKLFINTIFVSGGGGPGMKGRGTVEIQDGSIVSKLIELGLSSGSECTLRMVGSKASGVVVEDGLQIGVYNYLSLESNPPPSSTVLDFELDAEGVTPDIHLGQNRRARLFSRSR